MAGDPLFDIVVDGPGQGLGVTVVRLAGHDPMSSGSSAGRVGGPGGRSLACAALRMAASARATAAAIRAASGPAYQGRRLISAGRTPVARSSAVPGGRARISAA